MPSTRKRRPRVSKRPANVEEWQLVYLLTGEEPEPGTVENPFHPIIFIGADPRGDPCRWGNFEPWFRVWERIKNDPLVKRWQKENGKTHAEELLEEISHESV